MRVGSVEEDFGDVEKPKGELWIAGQDDGDEEEKPLLNRSSSSGEEGAEVRMKRGRHGGDVEALLGVAEGRFDLGKMDGAKGANLYTL